MNDSKKIDPKDLAAVTGGSSDFNQLDPSNGGSDPSNKDSSGGGSDPSNKDSSGNNGGGQDPNQG